MMTDRINPGTNFNANDLLFDFFRVQMCFLSSHLRYDGKIKIFGKSKRMKQCGLINVNIYIF